MTRKIWRRTGTLSLLMGLALGCGRSEPEVKPDPELASKPFPTVSGATDKAAPAKAFPGVGGRQGP